jgi:uncharacterized membrane protein
MGRIWRLVPVTAAAILCVSFAATGPWRVGSVDVRYWQPMFGIFILALLSMLVSRSARGYALSLLTRDIRFSRRAVIAAFVIASALLIHICLLQYQAFEVNAWDFSNSFDRPIEQTLHGRLLWSDTLGTSMLGIHCNWIDLLFVPLYAIVATPYWLLIANALAFSSAALVLFLYVRHSTSDDFVAACVAIAFFLSRYAVRAMRVGFLADVLYPLAFFLLLYAFRRSSLRLGLFALFLILSIKEDAILPLLGFAAVAALLYRRWTWAAMTAGVAIAGFAFNYFHVLPKFGGPPVPFAFYWGSFGDTPLSAAAAMLRNPMEVVQRVSAPLWHLLSTLAFMPLAGYGWLLAALPAIVVTASSDQLPMHHLARHYSLPFLALLFASASDGIARLGAVMKGNPVRARRIVAIVFLLASTFVDAGYKMERARPERHHVADLLAAAGARTVYIQGAIYPHAGYESRHRALHHKVVPPPGSAFLLCTTCSPYPFEREELDRIVRDLRRGARYQQKRAGDLWLFVPR